MRSSPFFVTTLAVLALAAACSHVVMIKSTPPGATVRIDGDIKGVTPLMFEEATGFGRRYELELALPGYQTEKLSIAQGEWWPGCVWPSLCLIPLTCGLSASGLFFARALRDEYHYMLSPLPAAARSSTAQPAKKLPSTAPPGPPASSGAASTTAAHAKEGPALKPAASSTSGTAPEASSQPSSLPSREPAHAR